ncbi:hypothetical protein SAMN05444920_14912 [Nonomuraea solani]|uniref:Uncharacterized protein n=1 Tax=Nonomuraea solani TaxID=1144553 RepID=A0A1H6F1J8_9ACTN|nr:hypothetical protein SAMN05444920_14912 [Nonomuraea solani]
MSRHKMISVLALLLTTGYIAFVLLAPASVTKPISAAVVVGLLIACLVASLRAVYLARRAARRTQPCPERPQPPTP